MDFGAFYPHMGFEILETADGTAHIRLAHRPQLANLRGETHGGAQAALADVGMAQAVLTRLTPGTTVGTVSMTTTFLRPAHGDLLCEGTVIQVGRSLATAEARITDQDGQLVLRAMATYRVYPPRFSEGRTHQDSES
ncbi:MAG: PaaI family thioesterase [Chloroflexi bacterium]|nr:PaaI family thioesterase [Chloroflexota bacterium]